MHAWVGVLASLLGFIVFFFGVFALFVDDMRVWQDPALHVAEPSEPPSFNRLLEVADEVHPLSPKSSIGFWRQEGTRYVVAFLGDAKTRTRTRLWLDPVTGNAVPERSRLSEELYGMHFFTRVPKGKDIAGLLAIALMVALVSGLLVHLRALPKQWWRFRPRKRLRVSYSDGHKVLGVFTLPFAVALLWSGAVLGLGSWTDKGVSSALYSGDPRDLGELTGGVNARRKPLMQEAPALTPDELVAKAQEAEGWNGAPGYVSIRLLGDANSYARVDLEGGRFAGWHRVILDSVNGEVLASAKQSSTPSQVVDQVLYDLHFGRYGGTILEFLYALLSLAVAAVIITGNLIWLERRDPKRERAGNRLLERFTIGVACGAVLGTAMSLAANRLVPLDLAARSGWELRALLWGWGLAVVFAFTPRVAPRTLAGALLMASSALFGGVVAKDVICLDANLFTAIGLNLPAVFTVELLLSALALGTGVLAWKLLRTTADSTKEQ
tara:strand:- start:1454 stop:2938 length:1485 start_codon:yes stop_codon:yes gene_type:complete